jgi:hypothetical protein
LELKQILRGKETFEFKERECAKEGGERDRARKGHHLDFRPLDARDREHRERSENLKVLRVLLQPSHPNKIQWN